MKLRDTKTGSEVKQETSARYPKPLGYRRLLETKNAKTVKGEKLGYKTGILYMAPADSAADAKHPTLNVCHFSGNCKTPCLFTAGRGVMTPIRNARVSKTHFYADNRFGFLNSLRYDIATLVRRSTKHGMIPAVRLNGTSDLPGVAMLMASEFPQVQFYDYTKYPQPWNRVRPNYHLTYSFDGRSNTVADAIEATQHGISVAVVFQVKTARRNKAAEPLPETWHGIPVVDGDTSDLRFLDQRGVIVGLRAKGRAKCETSEFVQPKTDLVQIAAVAAA